MDAIGFDSLTSFLDRRGCLRAAVRLVEACRRERRPLSVLWLDLDRFKQVNESFGHLGGDAVIAKIAARLNIALSGRAEVSRMGGDEFVFLIPDCDRKQAEEIAAELLRAVAEPIEIGSIRIHPSGSIGIAVLDDQEDPLSFIERADRAMVEAKRLGGGRHVVSGDEQVPGRVGVLLAREELAIESQIHAALETGGLTLHYQPIIGCCPAGAPPARCRPGDQAGRQRLARPAHGAALRRGALRRHLLRRCGARAARTGID